MARKPDSLPERSAPAEAALAFLLGRAAAAYAAALEVVMQSEDPEGPHQARVALRRLRAHLKAARPLTEDRALAPLEERARTIFRILGRLRDADVLLHDLGGLDPAALTRAHEEAARIREEVRAELRAAGAERLPEEIAARLAAGGWQGKRAARPFGKYAAAALERARERLEAHGRHLADMPDDERHELRKDLKTLRYLVDDLGPLWPAGRVAPLRKRLRRLQDALGTLNDLAMAEARGLGDPEERARRRAEALEQAEAEWTALRKAKAFW